MTIPGTSWHARLEHLRTHPTARLRATGTAILVAGCLVAIFVYITALRDFQPGPYDPLEGHSKAADRQVRALMGNFGLLARSWSDALTSPGGKAVGVLVLAGLFAGYFFRVASVMDAESAEASRAREDDR